jgi:hypothetical protein
MQSMQSISNPTISQCGTTPPLQTSNLRSLARAFLPLAAAILTLVLSTASSSFAGSATWKKIPATNDWQTAANWTPRTVPNGPLDTATFASSNQTGVDLAQFGDIEVNGIVFKPGASAFTISTELPNLIISGVGITNNSGIVQNFAPSGPAQITFLNGATAGSLTAFTNGGSITFGDTSTAGNATFTNNGLIRLAPSRRQAM